MAKHKEITNYNSHKNGRVCEKKKMRFSIIFIVVLSQLFSILHF